MKKVIITGAAGFIGKALTELLLEKGITVYGVDIYPDGTDSRIFDSSLFIPVKADFSKYSELSEMIKDDIDVFYHFAWQGGFASDSLRDYRLQLKNSIAACDAVDQAIKIGCGKFVFAGTCNEFELIPYMNSSDITPRYTCVYSAAKMASELIGKTYAFNNRMDFCGGLIAMSYGEKNRAKTLPNIIIGQLLNNVTPKLIEGSGLYDMVYISDIAGAFAAIGEKGRALTSYYIGHRNLRTFKEIMTDIRDIIDPEASLDFGAFPDAASIDYSLIDLDALYRDTGFECTADFRESILNTAGWMKEMQMNNVQIMKGGGGEASSQLNVKIFMSVAICFAELPERRLTQHE